MSKNSKLKVKVDTKRLGIDLYAQDWDCIDELSIVYSQMHGINKCSDVVRKALRDALKYAKDQNTLTA